MRHAVDDFLDVVVVGQYVDADVRVDMTLYRFYYRGLQLPAGFLDNTDPPLHGPECQWGRLTPGCLPSHYAWIIQFSGINEYFINLIKLNMIL